jgi:hypothetical protein
MASQRAVPKDKFEPLQRSNIDQLALSHMASNHSSSKWTARHFDPAAARNLRLFQNREIAEPSVPSRVAVNAAVQNGHTYLPYDSAPPLRTSESL